MGRFERACWAALVSLWACGGTDDGDGSGGSGGSGASGGSGGAGGGAGAAGSGGGGADACEALSARLDDAIATVRAGQTQAAGGVQMAVVTAACNWEGVAGEAHDGVPMSSDHVLRIGSVTKTYVATTLLTLQDEGALSLDDPLDDFVPGVPGGDAITVRMLLNHTSGIFNYTDDGAYMQELIANPDDPVAPAEMVDRATQHPPDFAPGQGWSYSNTGFILAGMVIEAVAGDVGDALRERALVPAQLAHTFFDGEESVSDELATGYGFAGLDVTHALHPSVPWTAGSMVATAGDIASWAVALYGGSILPAAALDEMLTPVATPQDGVSYGLGAFLYDAAILGGVGDGVGHSGGIPGFTTEMLYLTTDGTAIAVIVNSEAADRVDYVVAALQAIYDPA